ncbi:MAG: hypothetical protein ACTSVI_03895 [Promethearchaeota archaeon]
MKNESELLTDTRENKNRNILSLIIKPFVDEAHQRKGFDLPPVTEEEIKNFKRESFKGFDRVGYARPLGGWFYQFFYALLGMVPTVILYPFILGVLYPQPEIKAYNDVAGVLFSILFFAFNVPTNFAIERWVADYRIKNPEKMLQFMSFYIWYQMMSGLILVTSTSLYIFWIVVNGRLAYVSWLMLVLITREYPAMLNIFLQSIKGLQKFDYESKINFIKAIWEKGFEIAGVLFGRFVIGQNPAIGPLIGSAIGYAIGTYIDDFFSAFLSGWYLHRYLKTIGLSVLDAIRPNFTWEIVKLSFWFGFKLSLPGIFNTIVGFFIFFSWYDAVPAYATFVVLNKLADELANISKRSEGINTKGAFSEAINNGKYKLAQYYIANTFKYYGFFTVGLGCLVIGYLPVLLSVLFVVGEAEAYLLAIPFILPNIIATLFEQPSGEAGKILIMGDKPLFNSLMEIITSILNIFFMILWLYVLKLPQTYGFSALVWLLPMGGFIPSFIKLVISWIYINKFIVKVKLAIWQSFVAPLIPGILSIVTGYAWGIFIFPELSLALGPIIAAAISILIAFLFGLIFNFIILYGFFGGWDEHTLAVFKEAVYISGPSRVLFIPVYKITKVLLKYSKFYNRFPMDYKDAEREMIELMIQREKVQKQILENKKED